MRSNSSSVAGWLVPARGTCSRKLSSPSCSIRQSSMPCCASASDRQSPTGPAPTTITRLDVLCMYSLNVPRTRWAPSPVLTGGGVGVRGPSLARRLERPPQPARRCRGSPTSPRKRGEVERVARDRLQSRRPQSKRARSILRGDHVLHRPDPAGVGEIEHDAERILVFGLVIRVRRVARLSRLRSAGEILSAGAHELLLGFVEIIHPHAEMIDSDRLVAFLSEQRGIDGPVGDIEATAGLSCHFHVEGFLEKLGGFFRIGNNERDVAKLGHDLCPCEL